MISQNLINKLSQVSFPEISVISSPDPHKNLWSKTSSIQDRSEDEIRQAVQSCKRCSARLEASFPVPPEFPVKPPLRSVIIARNPGIVEDKKTRPLHPDARGGSLFNEWLEVLSLERSSCYITNTLFCHTASDRVPDSSEYRKCILFKPYEFSYLVKTYKSSVLPIILMGNDAVYYNFPSTYGSTLKLMGSAYLIDLIVTKDITQTCLFIPLVHPGFVLRNPTMKKEILSTLSGLRRAFYFVDRINKGEF